MKTFSYYKKGHNPDINFNLTAVVVYGEVDKTYIRYKSKCQKCGKLYNTNQLSRQIEHWLKCSNSLNT